MLKKGPKHKDLWLRIPSPLLTCHVSPTTPYIFCLLQLQPNQTNNNLQATLLKKENKLFLSFPIFLPKVESIAQSLRKICQKLRNLELCCLGRPFRCLMLFIIIISSSTLLPPIRYLLLHLFKHTNSL